MKGKVNVWVYMLKVPIPPYASTKNWPPFAFWFIFAWDNYMIHDFNLRIRIFSLVRVGLL